MDASVDMPSKFLKDVINPWLLGADPEFAVVTPPDTPVLNAGAEAVNTTKPAGAIGYDHSGRVWELRPSPSPSAYVVTTNLWKLLMQNEMDKVAKFKWKSGALGGRKGHSGASTFEQWVASQGCIIAGQQVHNAFGPVGSVQQFQAAYAAAQAQATVYDTLGGHVHFGIGGFNPAQRAALSAVTTGLLSLDILPHKENSQRLALTAHSQPHYGHLTGGDAVRDCNGHVEFRCAPSWLDKPGQALAALTVYKLAAARPSSVEWPDNQQLKSGLLSWLDQLASVDVDAWILSRYVESRGFEAIQADPSNDFKPLWRRPSLWER